MTVTLRTRDGAAVATREIPNFKGMPQVLLWGNRAFVMDLKATFADHQANFRLSHASGETFGAAVYTETFAYAIPEGPASKEEGS